MDISSPIVKAFENHPPGLCGAGDPAAAVRNVDVLEQRISVLTLGAVLSTSPLGTERWEVLAALKDHWLLDPTQAAYRTSAQLLAEMQRVHMGGPQYIARVWWQICRGVQGRFKGSWRGLLSANNDDASALLAYFQKSKATFPVLSGEVILVRWLDLIHRIGGVPLRGWENLSVPLPPGLKEAAGKFGIAGDEVHPLTASALETWSAACRGFSGEACGFAGCPSKRE